MTTAEYKSNFDFSKGWTCFLFPAKTETPAPETFNAIPETLLGTAPHHFDLKANCFDLDYFRDKHETYAVSYVFGSFEADRDLKLAAGVSADWWIELCVNGRRVMDTNPQGNDGGNFIPEEHILDIELKKGKNLIAARIVTGAASGAFAFGNLSDYLARHGELSIDFEDNKFGKLRPRLHGTGTPPPFAGKGIWDYTDFVKEMHFTSTRTHDWPLVHPGERMIDTHFIFPLMHLDENDPRNYYFAPTDKILQQALDMGFDIIYRLGTSIEHTGDVHFNSNPPEDFDKYAEVLAGIVRHYTQGWADGFHMPIKYWEIWNEPELQGHMCWNGDMPLFEKLFVTILKRLKQEFPELKIGGPAFCGYSPQKFDSLLRACKDAGVTPDFISWHSYSNALDQMPLQAICARRLLDSFGFDKCETILNEWHYLKDWHSIRGTGEAYKAAQLAPDGIYNIDSAAFNVGTIAAWHDTTLDQANFYGCNLYGTWGYLDIYRSKSKVFYSMKVIGELMHDYKLRINAYSGVPTVRMLGGLADDGSCGRLLVVSYKSDAHEVVIDCKGAQNLKFNARILDQDTNLEPVEVTFADGKLTLKKRQPGSAVFAVDFERI